jgi:hypothetical protein
VNLKRVKMRKYETDEIFEGDAGGSIVVPPKRSSSLSITEDEIIEQFESSIMYDILEEDDEDNAETILERLTQQINPFRTGINDLRRMENVRMQSFIQETNVLKEKISFLCESLTREFSIHKSACHLLRLYSLDENKIEMQKKTKEVVDIIDTISYPSRQEVNLTKIETIIFDIIKEIDETVEKKIKSICEKIIKYQQEVETKSKQLLMGCITSKERKKLREERTGRMINDEKKQEEETNWEEIVKILCGELIRVGGERAEYFSRSDECV